MYTVMAQSYSECYNTGSQVHNLQNEFLFERKLANPRKFQPSKFFGYAVCSTAKHSQVSDKTSHVHECSYVHPVILISSIQDRAKPYIPLAYKWYR